MRRGLMLAAALGGATLLCGQEAKTVAYRAAAKDGVAAGAARLASTGLAPAREFRLAALEAMDRSDRERIGVHRKPGREAMAAGHWETLAGGGRLWRVALRSPGAAGVRVHFRAFDAGAGRVWVHDGAGAVSGPWSGRGIFGDGDFWTPVVFGEAAVIEYEAAAGAGAGDAPPFEMAEVAHIWTSPEPEPEAVKAGTESNQAAARCHLDVTCSPEWADAAKAVARITLEKDGGTYLCSGTLMNTSDQSFTPYFLTAQHCLDDDQTARTVVAYWFYQSAQCNAAPPAVRSVPSVLGARYVAGRTFEESDFTLLRLTSVPNGAVFAGWTADEPGVGSPIVGIHHPTGDYKRISFGERAADGRMIPVPIENFYRIRWTRGRTEGGSSGSPIFNENRQVVGVLSHGDKGPPGGTVCDSDPFYDFYGRFSRQFATLRPFLEGGRGVDPGDGGSGSGGGGGGTNPGGGGPTAPTVLTSGRAAEFAFPAVSNGTLFNGNFAYRVTVPEGATRLEVKLSTATAGVDVDLFVRRGADPTVESGRITADFRSTGDTGEETIVITANSSPRLQAGVYHIAMAVYTRDIAARGAVTATVTTAPPATAPALSSGVPAAYNLPPVTRATLFNGGFSYRVEVPEGATRLEVRLSTTTPDTDVDLFVRFGADVTLSGGSVVSDFSSTGDAGDERIVITPESTPALRAGTYFISLGLFTPNKEVRGNLVAAVTTEARAPDALTQLTSGVPARFNLPAVDGPTLFNGPYGFRIAVPAGTARMEVRVVSSDPAVDVDLYVRQGEEPVVAEGSLVADYSSARDSGNEFLAISTASSPPLREGDYYISLVLFATGKPAAGTVTVTLVRDNLTGRPLNSGEPAEFRFDAVARPTLFTGASSFRIVVPEGSARLRVEMRTATPDVDTDLYVRREQDNAVVDGRALADFRSTGDTGDETIDIGPETSPALAPGVYYISVSTYTTGREARGTVTATVASGEGKNWTELPLLKESGRLKEKLRQQETPE